METLLSLFISSFVVLLLTGGILQVLAIRETMVSNAQDSSLSHTITGDRQVEWHIFLNQLEHYLQGTHDPIIGQFEFQVKEKTQMDREYRTVFYRRGGEEKNFIRRTHNGNHRMLTGIEEMEFNKSGGWLNIKASFQNGDQYSGKIWIESWKAPVDIDEENKGEDEDSKMEEVKEGLMEDGKRIDDFNEEKTTENKEPQEEVPTEKVTNNEEKEGFE